MGTIACECSAIGALSKLLIEDGGTAPRTFTNLSERLEFVYEKLGTKRALQYTGAITGSLSRFRRGVREHSYLVQGVIAIQPSPANLDLWLPRIFGGTLGSAPSGILTDYDVDLNDKEVTLDNTLPEFDALVYRENGIFQYTDLQVAQAFLRGKTSNAGNALEFMELIMVMVGQTEIVTQTGDPSPWPSPEPALPTTVNYDPYAIWETSLKLNGTNIPYEQITMSVNNNLSISFYDELTPQCIRSTGRDVKIDAIVPFNCDALRESLDMNTTEGTANLIMQTPNPVTFHTEFSFPYARSTFETPVTNGKSEIKMPITIEAYSNTGNDEVVINTDSTV